jgi:hypothetical protein
MSQQQQTVLKVQTNKPNFQINLPEGTCTVSATGTTMLVIGSGTTTNPFIGLTISGATLYGEQAYFDINNSDGTVYYVLSGQTYEEFVSWESSSIYLIRNGVEYLSRRTTTENPVIFGSVDVRQGDRLRVTIFNSGPDFTSMPYLYFVPNENSTTAYEDLVLDLYGDIPIKINRSFAELQDIAKKNSDYSIGLALPGSKKNNKFFESFFNVDVDTLYFNPLLRTPAKVLIDDEIYFTGYLKLNKISVLNSKVEYDVTLFSNISDLFGKIGNNLLKDLPYGDPTRNFNHNFSNFGVLNSWGGIGFNYPNDPNPYIYPIVHNGYNYTGDTVNLSGTTVLEQTRLYTTSSPISGYTSQAAMYAAGVKPYRLNTRGTAVLDNQLKPALNLWSIMQLLFKTYGYTIKSDFMNTPWMKGLYMYGYFNSDTTKFSYTTDISEYSDNTQSFRLTEVSGTTYNATCDEDNLYNTYTFTIVNSQTGVAEAATQPYTIAWNLVYTPCNYPTEPIEYRTEFTNVMPGNTSVTFTWNYLKYVPCPSACQYELLQQNGQNLSNSNLFQFNTSNAPQTVFINDGDYVDFSLIINNTIKQIDVLSSIAKKFNLVFVPDPEVPNQIIVEPYQYYVGTGSIYDWTDKLSYDKGWSVQPALNFVESELILTDLEDGDDGNKQFKDKNSRIYGQNYVFNQTDFKSQTKKIETIFSPQITRKWDNNVAIPLGINYVSANSPDSSGDSEKVRWTYKGVKTKPKIFYYLGNKSIFLNTLGEVYDSTYVWATNYVFIMPSNGVTNSIGSQEAPVISNTMPLGNPDSNKINNDSICILFNSELPTDVGVETFDAVNAYTDKDMYNLFYENRINNLYNPNTRFLEGYFWLKLSDIKNLEANDIIKIKDQYFTWNKINQYNLTDRELTKVELIQIDNNPSVYPTRYFQYNYCAQPSYKYNIKTDFTNPQMNLTHFYISNWYDYYVGLLGGSVSGVTSSFKIDEVVGPISSLPFTMYEVTKDTYETTGNPYTSDPNVYWDYPNYMEYNLPSYWTNSGFTKQGINLWANCSDFADTAAANGIIVATPSGGTPTSIYNLNVTINVTNTGWIKYNTAEYPDGTYTFFGSLGVQDIPGCVECSSIRFAYPFADLGYWTVVDCGIPC